MSGLLEQSAFVAAYFCCGKLGLSMAFVNASASAFWPPTGLAIAFLLWRGLNRWPGVFLGAFLVNIVTQGSPPVDLAIASGNTLEAVVGAWAVRRFANGMKAFENTANASKFFLLAGILSTTLSATVGVTSLCVGGFAQWNRYGDIWLTWWLGDMVSNLIFAPLLVVWLARPGAPLKTKEMLEAVGLALLTVAVGLGVFLGKTPLGRSHRPLEFLALPPLLWAAMRFGARGAISSTFLMSCLALWGTLKGWGPFVRSDPNESLLLLQAFMGTVSITGLVLALVVAERKHALRALAQNRDDLERLVHERTAKLTDTVSELESFSYSISHDMRGPLRAMQNFALLLEEDCAENLPPAGREYARRIREASNRMDLLIKDSLDYSRVLRQELPLEPVDLSALVAGVVETYPNLQPPSAEIQIDLNGVKVVGNQSALVQCFSNLLGNAVEFVAPGIQPRVRVFAEAKDRTIRIWIVDNGIGIPEIAVGKLFVMFHRLHDERIYPGTGIGLAIVRKAVERMNGSVGVESELGKGSRFWVELPLPQN